MTDYGSPLFSALREECRAEWDAYTHHSFVEGMRDGSLPNDSFMRYLRQDYLFLIHFARAWALAVVKSDRIDEMRSASALVHALIDEEMKLHIATCAEAGIDLGALNATEEAATTIAYTRYVMDAGYAGDLLDLLIVLSPCVMGYGEIGQRLHQTRTTDTTYLPWIETYSSEEYQGVCRVVGSLIETVAARRIGQDARGSARWRDLVRQFRAACVLERDFWDV